MKVWRKILWPFGAIYGCIMWVRNFLYDRNIIRSVGFQQPVITVGNLQLGGTGKSPMVEYLVRLLSSHLKCAILSRGYKRDSIGYRIAGPNDTAATIGDEPLQYYLQFARDVKVAVGEQRVQATHSLLNNENAEVVICDDALQHRRLKGGINILITPYSQLYIDDAIVPVGTLREFASGAQRAHIVVVSKCPKSITEHDAKRILQQLSLKNNVHLFFTALHYLPIQTSLYVQPAPEAITPDAEILLFTGIAHPEYLEKYLSTQYAKVYAMHFGDHHTFNTKDLMAIKNKFDSLAAPKKILVTTTKDMARLHGRPLPFVHGTLYVQPMAIKFLFDGNVLFDELIKTYVRKN